MYSIIIVDDEHRAQNAVSRYVTKNCERLKVMGCFSNGLEALEFLKNNQIHIVVTDIKMPLMDGLELARKIYELNIKCKIIIFSGFGEFEYAKKAMEYNVVDYLLKPINVHEFNKSIAKVVSALDSENKIDELLDLSRSKFIVDLFLGNTDPRDSLKKKFYSLNFPFGEHEFCGSLIEIAFADYDKFITAIWNHGEEKIDFMICNLVESLLDKSHVYIVSNKRGKLWLAVFNYCSQSTKDILTTELKEIIPVGFTVSVIYSFESIDEVSAKDLAIDEDEAIKLIVSHIMLGEKTEALLLLNRIMWSNRNVKAFYSRLIAKLTESFDISREELQRMRDDETLAQNVISLIERTDGSDSNAAIDKIKAYIQENCHRDISRRDIGEHMCLNETYVGRLFKQKVGKSIHDYYIEIRMQKAIEMLREDCKVLYISKKLGYRDKRSFIRNFKNYTGYPPAEYKNTILKVKSSDEDI